MVARPTKNDPKTNDLFLDIKFLWMQSRGLIQITKSTSIKLYELLL